MRETRKPPETISLVWCPACGRTDRHTRLKGKQHFKGGERCPGAPVGVMYVYEMTFDLPGARPDGASRPTPKEAGS